MKQYIYCFMAIEAGLLYIFTWDKQTLYKKAWSNFLLYQSKNHRLQSSFHLTSMYGLIFSVTKMFEPRWMPKVALYLFLFLPLSKSRKGHHPSGRQDDRATPNQIMELKSRSADNPVSVNLMLTVHKQVVPPQGHMWRVETLPCPNYRVSVPRIVQ